MLLKVLIIQDRFYHVLYFISAVICHKYRYYQCFILFQLNNCVDKSHAKLQVSRDQGNDPVKATKCKTG